MAYYVALKERIIHQHLPDNDIILFVICTQNIKPNSELRNSFCQIFPTSIFLSNIDRDKILGGLKNKYGNEQIPAGDLNKDFPLSVLEFLYLVILPACGSEFSEEMLPKCILLFKSIIRGIFRKTRLANKKSFARLIEKRYDQIVYLLYSAIVTDKQLFTNLGTTMSKRERTLVDEYLEKDFAEARAEGEAKGRAEGRAEAMTEFVRNLIDMGLDDANIQMATRLSLSEIQALRGQIKKTA
jgi:hypothetical protein